MQYISSHARQRSASRSLRRSSLGIYNHEYSGLAQDEWKAARCATPGLWRHQFTSVDCGICCTERALTQYNNQDQVGILTRKGMSYDKVPRSLPGDEAYCATGRPRNSLMMRLSHVLTVICQAVLSLGDATLVRLRESPYSTN